MGVVLWAMRVVGILLATGCFVLGAPLTYDRDERRLRNVLVDWWVRAETINENAGPSASRFAKRISETVLRLLASVFGERRISARMLWTALMFFNSGIAALYILHIRAKFSYRYFWWYLPREGDDLLFARATEHLPWQFVPQGIYAVVGLVALGLVPMLVHDLPKRTDRWAEIKIAIRRNWLAAALVVVFLDAFFGFYLVTFLTFVEYFHSARAVIGWISAMWALAYAYEIGSLIFIRWCLNRARFGSGYRYLAVGLVVPIIALSIPPCASYYARQNAGLRCSPGGGFVNVVATSDVLIFLPMDFVGLIISIGIGLVGVALVLNTLAWPVVSRLVYAAHTRFIDRRLWISLGMLIATSVWKTW